MVAYFLFWWIHNPLMPGADRAMVEAYERKIRAFGFDSPGHTVGER
jgi:hypothetical protein